MKYKWHTIKGNILDTMKDKLWGEKGWRRSLSNAVRMDTSSSASRQSVWLGCNAVERLSVPLTLFHCLFFHLVYVVFKFQTLFFIPFSISPPALSPHTLSHHYLIGGYLI